MKTFITRRGEGQGKTKKERKAREDEEGEESDDKDVYYPNGRRPREDEEGEESYEKQRQRPGRGASRALLRQHREEGCGECERLRA